ncbi:MAG: hypothetical protein R3F41_17845 [Gammaproteobacteria bacterium]|nr:hypothetical protein [Pseudomonadales bacterium]MCP5347412.1 hypothetical protein [Pseudomonadales bacterium]
MNFSDFTSSFRSGKEAVDSPLAYYEWVLSADDDLLNGEKSRLTGLSGLNSDPVSSVKLGMVNMALNRGANGGPPIDNLESLQQLCVSDTCTSYIRLGELLNQLIDTRRSLEFVRSEQAGEQATLSSMRVQIASLQQRIVALEEQIDALTNLEQEIIQREYYEQSQ